ISKDVAQRAHVHAKLAVVRLDLPDGVRTVVVEAVAAVGIALDNRIRQKRLENFLYRDRPRSRSPSAVGSREGLMQVDMKDVDAEISGPRYPHHRIQVRAIHIHKRTMRMNKLRNAGNLTFKNTQ